MLGSRRPGAGVIQFTLNVRVGITAHHVLPCPPVALLLREQMKPRRWSVGVNDPVLIVIHRVCLGFARRQSLHEIGPAAFLTAAGRAQTSIPPIQLLSAGSRTAAGRAVAGAVVTSRRTRGRGVAVGRALRGGHSSAARDDGEGEGEKGGLEGSAMVLSNPNKPACAGTACSTKGSCRRSKSTWPVRS